MRKDVVARNNVKVIGRGERVLLFAHGFGCDQNVWRFVTPAFEERYRMVLFDYVGSGRSQLSAFSRERYSRLEGYAQDIVEICEALALERVTLVAHSVSGTIGLLASQVVPQYFEKLVMVCPSPCFLNAPGYPGGFEREDLQGLIDLMDKNYIGWANYLAPLVMGIRSPEALKGELSGSFCSTDPVVAKTFALATFFSDHRSRLAGVKHPALLLQSRVDALAPAGVGEYMNNEMPRSMLEIIDAEGHCLHMTHPQAVVDAMRRFLEEDTL